MTSDVMPVRGSVQLRIRDQQSFWLALLWRRAAIVGFIGLLGSAFVFRPLLVERFNEARAAGGSIPGALLETLPAIIGASAVFIPLFALVLVLFCVLVVPLGLLRAGRDRRVLAYEIDENGVRTKDALGAELVLPWSNVTRVIFTKRLLMIRLRPRGWRYVVLRAFASHEVTRIRDLAFRMVGLLSKPGR